MTEQEELEYLELLELESKANAAAPAPAALPPAPQSLMKSAINAGKAVGGAALTALDYPGGIMRTGIYAVPRAIKAVYDQDPAQAESMQEDLLNALKGRAPTGAQLLAKLGVEEGDKSRILGREISTRDLLGFGSDLATGLNASKAVGLLAKSGGATGAVGKVLRAPEAALEAGIKAGGKKIYQSGLKAGDFVAKRFGKGEKALSETLLKKNIKGSATQIADQALEYADELRARQQEILADASAKGARVDMGQVLAPLKRDVSKIVSGTNTLGVKNAAEAFGKELDNLIESGSATPARVSSETMPRTISTGVGEQGALFGQAELPVARQVRQAAVNADEALKGVPTEGPALLPADDLQRQLELLPNAESTRLSSPAAYVDESVQYAAQPGQVPLIPESAMLQPGSRVIDPIAEVRLPGREALTATKASEIKTQLANQAGDQAFDLFKRSKPGSKLFKRAQNRTKIAVEQSVAKVDPARASELREVNRELGNILTSKPVLAAEARKEAMKNAVTSVDAPLAILSPQAAIVKKLADIAKGTGARTRAGASLYYNPYEYLNATRTGAINVGNGNE